MTGRAHLSIGEVLSLLQEEFPDVTISKIRFLESQGLVDPERTPSGYRKFYEPDIERLRWVLRQQRDAFLPLKVIKGRLAQGDEGADQLSLEGLEPVEGSLGSAPPPAGLEGPARAAQGLSSVGEEDTVVVREVTVEHYLEAEIVPGAKWDSDPAGAAEGRALVNGEHQAGGGESPNGTDPSASASPAPGRPRGGPREKVVRAASGTGDKAHEGAAVPGSSSGASPGTPDGPGVDHLPAPPAQDRSGTGRHPSQAGLRPSAAARGGRRGGEGPRPPVVAADAAEELSLDELVSEAGVEVDTVRDLERFGLISPRVMGGASYYPPEAVVIARLAGAFARHGVEARHLRAYKGAAEREAGLVQQVIMPLIRQRNPEARQAAAQAVEELSELGGSLRTALLRSALADLR